MTEDDYMLLIKKYHDIFGEGPPIFGMEEQESIDKMTAVIETGKEITDTPDKDIPDGAFL